MEDSDNDLFSGTNRADSRDPEEMSALERKHMPVITAPDEVKTGEPFEVKVEAGKYKEHPNEHGHFIQEMEIFSGRTFLARATFASARTDPSTTFTLRLDKPGNLIAFVHCNLHGTWKSFPKEIEVKG